MGQSSMNKRQESIQIKEINEAASSDIYWFLIGVNIYFSYLKYCYSEFQVQVKSISFTFCFMPHFKTLRAFLLRPQQHLIFCRSDETNQKHIHI